tara:strand:+ start:312 stop:503 length:192 start_codon:yes stop_codon:yes gene_type:complete
VQTPTGAVARIKNFRRSEGMPKDFWNYRVNPITGFTEAKSGKEFEGQKRYGITPKPLKLIDEY